MRYPLCLLALLLGGCSVGDYHYSSEAHDRVDMTMTGIPTVLGLGTLGTTIPLTAEYSLTAAHVAKYSLYRVKAYHPDCDLAVVYHKNSPNPQPKFRNGMIGDKINMYGYSFLSAMPVASSGTNLINTGLTDSWNKASCVVVATNAGVVQGMSGGAVYNASDDSIAGVIVGYASSIKDKKTGKNLYKDVSLYVPYTRFKDWLDNATKS
ncbi:trypsin-like peptidase domain-containing protein [Erwinia amylovora]|uniref:Serine protease n=5 Tax=Erwinia amylovora TaxID=552 RepID=A0A831A3F3_ERWAM|nr:trypsin-like peptidase domain-containing protein [Erwinia amylovora]CBX79513.1 hypothetical protein predicted by Glimmer/Critica [Erwinia amylovora ATCC BAA-2158]CCP02009.1 hypothetical protein BN439_0921 [Erwinia amylovora Ea644]CCP06028.1 hypothetical protein BN440_0978 [Erwinia amylovora MR1]CDK14254.1 hypothetical protein LA635_0630 [Erwinia amylovora LA635]CDK17621.1 hypothetical protein LA636_0629 [Erwinia amylovora LA636]CDK20990.1 hypothetical protein LA637_0630 [Erwinia amylovora 